MTVAIYEKTDNGMLRVGVFTPRKHFSIYAISTQFLDRHPHADPRRLYIAPRTFLMGKWVDGERVPFDYSVYEVNWDNGANACGTFSERFYSEKLAQQYADNWADERNLEDLQLTRRQVSNRGGEGCYTAEVIEVEDTPEPDSEELLVREAWER